MFQNEIRAAAKVCARAAANPPSLDLWPRACRWVDDADKLDEQAFTKQAWTRLYEERQDILRDHQAFWDQVRSNNVDPSSVPDPLTLKNLNGWQLS
jgi:hypothetical protein